MKKSFSFFVIVILAIVAGGYVYYSPLFEKTPPKVEVGDSGYWNLLDSIPLTISDDTGVKYYKITFNDGVKTTVLARKVLTIPQKEVTLKLNPPSLGMFFKAKTVKLTIEAVDSSKWNFFRGNKTLKTLNLKIDKRKPEVSIIRNTFAIRRGGSAVAIVKITDANLKSAYVEFNNKIKFNFVPFYKKNYYIALIAWPLKMKQFNRFNVVATDKANNVTIRKIPVYIKNIACKKGNLKISDDFIDNISTDIIKQSNDVVPDNAVDIFKYENDVIRARNVATIKSISRRYMDRSEVDSFSLYPFSRLEGSTVEAGFCDDRHYIYHHKQIDEVSHMGLDMASVKHAPIIESNMGKVIFYNYLGIYGNAIIVDHGLGLQTLYAHTSSSTVRVGDNVRRGEVIARTGSTGGVMGDHLHFGVLVQGIEVNPKEWMDKSWIKTRIIDVINSAKKAIDL